MEKKRKRVGREELKFLVRYSLEFCLLEYRVPTSRQIRGIFGGSQRDVVRLIREVKGEIVEGFRGLGIACKDYDTLLQSLKKLVGSDPEIICILLRMSTGESPPSGK